MNTTTTIYSIKTTDDILLFNGKHALYSYLIHNCDNIDLKAIYVKQLKPLHDGRLIFDLVQALEFAHFQRPMQAIKRVTDELSGKIFDLTISNTPLFVIKQVEEEYQQAVAKKWAYLEECLSTLIDIRD